MDTSTTTRDQEQPSGLRPEDAVLVRRAKAGDLDAFETLATRHERRIYSLALSILRHQQDAEDVTQQTLLSALQNLQGFREESSFSTWLLRIATHAALKIIRKRRGLPTVPLESDPEASNLDGIRRPQFIADWRETPEQLLLRDETRILLEQALDQLDEKHRLIFLLRDIEGLSIKETAEAAGISEANTKVRLLRARLQLREILTQALGDPSKRLTPDHEH